MSQSLRFASVLVGTVALGAFLVGVASSCGAVETRFWSVGSRLEFEAGEAEGVAIDADGVLSLALRKTELMDSDELYFWDLAAGADGRVLIGTGDHGRVLELRNGESKTLSELDLLEVMALAVGDDGTIYAGGAQGGRVYAISADGETSVHFDSEQGVVLDLLMLPDGDLVVATGDAGRVYRVAPDGTGDVIYESSDPHVLSLEAGAEGDVLFGTAGEGLLGRIASDGRVDILYDALEDELRAIALTGTGEIVFAANSSPSAENGDHSPAVYRLVGRGSARRILRLDSSFVFDLVAEEDGSVLVGTGDEAALYRVDPLTARSSKICGFDESQLLSVFSANGGLLVSTGDPARLYRIGPEFEATGTLTGEVWDAAAEAQWSRIRWVAGTESDGSVMVETRSGNQSVPDATWSDWVEARHEEDGAHVIESPAARFFQWKLTLEGGHGDSPRVAEVITAYREVNLAPELSALVVSPKGGDLMSTAENRTRSVRRELPSGVEVNYTLPIDVSEFDRLSPAAAQWAVGLRTASWIAFDPNGDMLTYFLYYRPLESERWFLLAEDLTDLVYTWDASAFPDGWYRLKVVASDERSNSEAEALREERVGRPFEIDNTPPEVTRLEATLDEGECRVRVEARDDRSAIIRAEVMLDGREWNPASPAAGLLDAKGVEIDQRFPAESQKEGDPIVVRLFDETGNMSVSRAFLK